MYVIISFCEYLTSYLDNILIKIIISTCYGMSILAYLRNNGNIMIINEINKKQLKLQIPLPP